MVWLPYTGVDRIPNNWGLSTSYDMVPQISHPRQGPISIIALRLASVHVCWQWEQYWRCPLVVMWCPRVFRTSNILSRCRARVASYIIFLRGFVLDLHLAILSSLDWIWYAALSYSFIRSVSESDTWWSFAPFLANLSVSSLPLLSSAVHRPDRIREIYDLLLKSNLHNSPFNRVG